jgi:hypothetical protein
MHFHDWQRVGFVGRGWGEAAVGTPDVTEVRESRRHNARFGGLAGLVALFATASVGVYLGISLATLARIHRAPSTAGPTAPGSTAASSNGVGSAPTSGAVFTMTSGPGGPGPLPGGSGVPGPLTSSSVQAIGAPGAPGAITAVMSDRGGEILVTLRWSAASGNGGPVTGYLVRLFHSGDFDLSSQATGASATFDVPCGGAGCLDHPFAAAATVSATNASGTGPAVTGTFSGDLPHATLRCSGDGSGEVVCQIAETAASDRIDWLFDGTAAPSTIKGGVYVALACSGVPVHTIEVTVTNGAGTAVRSYTTNALDCA